MLSFSLSFSSKNHVLDLSSSLCTCFCCLRTCVFASVSKNGFFLVHLLFSHEWSCDVPSVVVLSVHVVVVSILPASLVSTSHVHVVICPLVVVVAIVSLPVDSIPR